MCWSLLILLYVVLLKAAWPFPVFEVPSVLKNSEMLHRVYLGQVPLALTTEFHLLVVPFWPQSLESWKPDLPYPLQLNINQVTLHTHTCTWRGRWKGVEVPLGLSWRLSVVRWGSYRCTIVCYRGHQESGSGLCFAVALAGKYSAQDWVLMGFNVPCRLVWLGALLPMTVCQ